MPEKEEERKAEVADRDAVKGGTEAQTVKGVKASPPWPLITIGVVATVVVVAVVIGGWAFVVGHERGVATSQTRTLGRYGMMNGQGNGGQYGGSQYFNRGGFRRGGALQSSAASGVVTAINGDTITVSGQGKQVTVKKSDSTTISGDETSVAVNDTVVVYGTTNSDGSITATRIVIRNQSTINGSDSNTGDAAPGA